MRLQVFLSSNGVCSRRQAMELVKTGRVSVNGRPVTEPSFSVEAGRDRVTCDGRPVEARAQTYVLLNKPPGVVTTRSDRFAGTTVLDLLPEEFRHLNPVGRLDKDTEGLLLLTNDGALALKLTHPRFDVCKTYVVRIQGRLTPEEKKRLEQGVIVEGRKTAPAQVRHLRSSGHHGSEFEMTIHEGRKRQIRHMLAAVGHRVVFLKRVRQGPLVLGALRRGTYRLLTAQEIRQLKEI